VRRAAAAALLGCALSFPATAGAATIGVTTSADEHDTGSACSLREAVGAANANAGFGGCTGGDGGATDTIELPTGTYALTRTGAGEDANETGDLDADVSDNGGAGGPLVIRGVGGARPTIDALGVVDRALDLAGAGAFELDHVRVANGIVSGSNLPTDRGGAIRWLGPGAGDITVRDSVLAENSAAAAAAVEAGTTGAHLIEDSTISGGVAGALGQVHSAGELTVRRSTVEHGTAGGISAEGAGPDALLVDSSTISENQNSDTPIGAIQVSGDAEITNTTIADNIGGFVGGIDPLGALVVRFSTIAGNGGAQPLSPDNVGGIDTDGAGPVTLEGVILAGNRTTDGVSNCNDASAIEGAAPNLESDDTCGLDSGSGSLIDSDPLLAPLAANGGPTATAGLYPGSPARDAAGACGLALDQRGEPRDDGDCDLGAFEGTVPFPPPPPPPAGGATTPIQPVQTPAKAKRKKKRCKRRGKAKRRRCGR
jgi:CSLREA domain-containing protein